MNFQPTISKVVIKDFNIGSGYRFYFDRFQEVIQKEIDENECEGWTLSTITSNQVDCFFADNERHFLVFTLHFIR